MWLAHTSANCDGSSSNTFCSASSARVEPATAARRAKICAFCSTSESWNDFGKLSKASRPNCVSTSSRAAASMSGVIVAPRALFSWRATSTTISRCSACRAKSAETVSLPLPVTAAWPADETLAMKAGLSANWCSVSLNEDRSRESPLTVAALGFTVEQAEPTSAAAATAAAKPTILSRGCTAGEPTGGPPAAHRQAAAARARSRRPSTEGRPSSAPAAAPRRARPCTRRRARGDGT